MAQQEVESISRSRMHVGGKLFGDLFSAAFTATLVAPSVTLIDRVLVEKVSSQKPLIHGLRTHALTAFERPRGLFLARPFAAVWSLYAATYAVSNSVDTVTREFNIAAGGTITFISTLAVNVPLGVRKDLQFARYYGTGSASDLTQGAVKAARAAIPKAATAAFLIRDALTIYGSFALPPRLAAAIPDDFASPHAKATLMQMTVPCLSQLAATPVHLLGLNLYDQSGKVPLTHRLAWIWRDLPAATAVRCARIIPAFALGLVVNIEVRSFFHGTLEAA